MNGFSFAHLTAMLDSAYLRTSLLARCLPASSEFRDNQSCRPAGRMLIFWYRKCWLATSWGRV